MMSVWKYTFEVDDIVRIAMPTRARLLSVQIQHGRPCLWALIDPDAATVDRILHILGTGHNTERVYFADYVGTFMQAGGDLVWHVFDGGEG